MSPSLAAALASSWLEHSVGAVDILESAVDPDLSFEDLTVLSDAGFDDHHGQYSRQHLAGAD